MHATFPLLHLETVLICTLSIICEKNTEAAGNLGYRFPWIHTVKYFILVSNWKTSCDVAKSRCAIMCVLLYM